MLIHNKFLFNFAASYSTGGYKRLEEYARWFNLNGGAWFVIHPRCADLVTEFPNIKFFVAKQSRIERLYNDCGYLNAIAKEIGRPALYYSYGIPLYSRFGKINWFHLSNVLPLGTKAIPLSLFERVKAGYLGRKIMEGFANADVISAESECSLGVLRVDRSEKLFLSVNGSDDELACLRSQRVANSENIATVVGTAAYKALEDSFRVFEMLRKTSTGLKLVIVGNPGWIPGALKGKQDVVIRGLLQRSDVIDCLRKTRFYISTTCIENSYNAAAEGIFFADESYISDIGPHRELLVNMPFEEVSVPGVRRPLLHVHRDSLTGANLKSWETVVVEMIARFHEAIRSGSSSPSTLQ
jgi:hypothetical protein